MYGMFSFKIGTVLTFNILIICWKKTTTTRFIFKEVGKTLTITLFLKNAKNLFLSLKDFLKYQQTKVTFKC